LNSNRLGDNKGALLVETLTLFSLSLKFLNLFPLSNVDEFFLLLKLSADTEVLLMRGSTTNSEGYCDPV